ncbi:MULTISPECIES: heparinase II/III domain-containing protein [unclassified Sphingobacterium]|uniref:heparinase II/III domain-containing protein n=1 Tax=unclassified Sphingobacterium TaxID=2609468 RepID=UPI0025EF1B3B|nr:MULTISPECIES: heparinase II/III family protein [unclassified Sphingobacterium]
MKIHFILLCSLFSVFFQTLQGKDLNLLTGAFKLEHLKANIGNDKSWVPYPSYSDRVAWNKLTAPFRDRIIKKGNEALAYQWQVVKATDYLEYERSGNRSIMEKPLNENCTALTNLLLAELAEGQGRYVDQILNGSWQLTEMATWSLSAHLGAFQSSKRSLPQERTAVVDLMAGDIGSLLSWIHYFFRDTFNQINPAISIRLKQQIQLRIIQPYLDRNDMWWQAFELKEGQLVNNWNPWCNFNVLTALLLVEDNPDIQLAGIYKTMSSVDRFINYVKTDGACEEGPSYWGHAAGKLYDYLKILALATKGKITIFDQPIIRDMGEYIAQSYIGGDKWVVNFADASAKSASDPLLIYRYGRDVNSSEMMQFARYMERLGDRSLNFKPTRDIFRVFEDLRCYPQLEDITAALPHNNFKWYPETQFIYLKKAPFFFAAKGGFNNESHNHNDVGNFILYQDQQPLFIDAGVGTYTKKTFSADRYSIWTMQSAYHNVPAINGTDQSFGKEYKAENVVFMPEQNRFQLDIGKAYPKSANITYWKRSYTLSQKGLDIQDEFKIIDPKQANIIHFLVAREPKIGNGVIILKNVGATLYFDPAKFTASFDVIPQEDSRLNQVWGKELYRIKLTAKNINPTDKYRFTIRQESL